MEPYYMPVRPGTDSEGRLLSLLPLAGDTPALARPPQPGDLPPELRGKLSHFDDAVFTTSMSVALEVGIATAFDAKVGFLQDVLVQDVRVGARYGIPSSSARSLIHAVYWGSSLRLTLRSSGLKLGATASLGQMAAQAQVENSRIDYELSIQGHAAGEPGILSTALRVLPVTGRFDVEVHAQFMELRGELVKRLIEATPPEPTRVIGVEVAYPLPASTLDETQARRFAMLQLVRKKPLADAVKGIPALKHPNPALLERMTRRVYTEELGLKEQDEVSEANTNTARGWLYV